jgi:DNA-binding LytR/AlgR family response regulator
LGGEGLARRAGGGQSGGAGRRLGRYGRHRAVTNGAPAGTSGIARWPDWALAYAVLIPVTAMFNTVNVLSYLDERELRGEPIEWWRPATWEATSGFVLLALAWTAMLMVRRFPPEQGFMPRGLAAHLAATIPFSLAHIGLMIGFREAIYFAAGEDYEFAGGSGALVYEYRKDLLSYAIYAATYWIVRRLRRRGETEPAPDLFTIDEGQRLIRVDSGQILGARSSGNYVEFLLADGRRPLMRTTLAAVEARLTNGGLVRTHRSWLVNPRHVAEATAEGSGDYGLTLTDGTAVPLSRRYPAALAALRPRSEECPPGTAG